MGGGLIPTTHFSYLLTHMHLDTFEKIAKQVSDLKRTGLKFDVVIQGDVHWQQGSTRAYFDPQHYSIANLTQLSQLQQTLGKPIAITGPNGFGSTKVDLGAFKPNLCTLDLSGVITDDRSFLVTRHKHNSVKFYSPNIARLTYFRPILISDAPSEKTEEEVTFRYIGTPTSCEFCTPHTSPLYNYLDKGFVYGKIEMNNDRNKIIITNELTPETYLVMLACFLHPNFAKQLENECFINFNKAKLFRIKFEKDMPADVKPLYDQIKGIVLTDYEKSVNSNMLVKVIKNELPVATYNRIKISKNSANYEGISLEAPGMLEFLHEKIIFDDRTDIYTIIGGYITAKIAELESDKFEVPIVAEAPVVEAVANADVIEVADGPDIEMVAEVPVVAEAPKEQVIEKAFKINGINISLKRSSANTRRTVNGMTINMDELDPVCYRASCFDNQEIFDKFVRSVHNMSLKWHDAIGSGLAVKIHDGLTVQEYKSAEAPMSCPRIRFLKDEKEVYLVTGEKETDKVPVKLNAAIKKIASLNRKTNNRYSPSQGYTPRNAAWARRELAKVLKECCTFEEKEPVLDAEGKNVLDANGKKTYNVTQNCMLTDDKAAFIGKMSQEYYEKAVQRSRIFLDKAVATTGAKLIEFNGSECWYVEGTLHKYAVCTKTNTVFNFDKGNYICIVEPGHRVEIGFDATAARLMALKNDQVTVAQVGTLRHG